MRYRVAPLMTVSMVRYAWDDCCCEMTETMGSELKMAAHASNIKCTCNMAYLRYTCKKESIRLVKILHMPWWDPSRVGGVHVAVRQYKVRKQVEIGN